MAKDKAISFKVTVEYICNDMISSEQLEDRFNNDVVLAYKFISDNHSESASSFADKEKVVKVKIIKLKPQTK